MLKGFFDTLTQFIPVLLTLLLAAASYWLALQAETQLFRQNDALKASSPDYFFKNFKSEYTRPGHLEALKLSGDKAEHFPRTETLVIQNPVAKQIIQPDIVTKLSANRGNFFIETEQLILTQNVHVKRKHNRQITTIETEQLQLDSIHSIINSNTKATIKQPGRTYTSQRFQYNNKSGEFKATNNVALEIEPNS